jgi:hypothetical protein
MISILPIFIIVLILIVFAVTKNIHLPSISVRHKLYIVILYAFILITSTITLYFIPKNNFISTKNTANMPNTEHFIDLASQNKLNKANGILQKKNWNFAYSDKTLKISNSTSDNLVLVERKNTDDEKIEVINYVTESLINGMDITDKIEPSSVELNQNELILYDGSNIPTKIKINKFVLDFTVSQFVNIPLSEDMHNLTLTEMKITYIRIPKSLQLDDTSSKNIKMIN